jgi:hypothetical protein
MDTTELPERVRYALDNAAEIARAPRVPKAHRRPGLLPGQSDALGRCDYGASDPQVMRCQKLATNSIHTLTVRRDYCPEHLAKVGGDVRARTPKRLGDLVEWH